MKWQDVSKIAKENSFVEEYDENLECPILDEDKVSRTATPNHIRLKFTWSYFYLFFESLRIGPVDGLFGTGNGTRWKHR